MECFEPIFAYTDESGNSGSNIFDNNQPYFWTGTLLSKTDLDLTDTALISECCEIICVSELHGNKLGLGKIEQVSSKLIEFIESFAWHFIFTKIKKDYIASTKLVDTLIDSGLNKAVSSIHYGVRHLRLNLALGIVNNTSPQMQREFWDVYLSGNPDKFKNILRKLRWNITNKVHDLRLKELLLDAIDWALTNPQVLLEGTRCELDSPNMVAFSLILNHLHDLLQDKNMRVKAFIHDEQNEFARSMEMMFKYLVKIKMKSAPSSHMADVELMDTYKCPLTIIKSHANIGLQVIDVVLWLIKRYSEKPWSQTNGCRMVIDRVMYMASISEFSHEQLYSDVRQGTKELYAKPISAKELSRGKEFTEEMEERRLKRMRELPEK